MNHSLETVEGRLDRLETWNKILLGIIALGCLAVLYGAKSDTAALRAKSIQLVGDSGGILAELTVREGNPGLYLNDYEGRTRAALFHAPDGTGLYVMDADGVTRIGVAQFAHGGGGVALHGKESRGAAVLYLKDEGSLRFYDAEGSITNEVPAQRPSRPD